MNSSSLSSARLLVALMVGVVISFLAATTAGQLRSMAIVRRVGDIVGNAMPSVEHLSQARSALRNTFVELNQMEDRPKSVQLRERALTHILELQEAVKVYNSKPYFPGEAGLAGELDTQIKEFIPELNETLNLAISADHEKFLRGLHNLRWRAQILDATLGRTVDFNAAQGQRLGLDIENIRVQSLIIVGLLDLISAVLAILATILSIRLFRKSLRETEDRANELDMFSARVAHDLKSPLGSILMACDLADHPMPNDQRSQLRDRVRHAARMMSSIIDGLLDFARTGAKPSYQVGDLAGALDNVVAGVRDEAANKEIDFVVEPYPHPVKVECSTGSLSSAMNNLVRNALKFVMLKTGDEHRVTVRMKALDGLARFEVEDTGPGVNPIAQDKIFEPYVRLNDEAPGLGLGLATVKRIVEAHGGKVGVRSVLGQGSLFWFELPVAH